MPILGLDIGGTQIKAGLISSEGEVLASNRIATPTTLEDFARQVPALVRGLGAGALEGVGIACKGVIHPRTTRVEVLPGTVSYLEGAHLRDFLPSAPLVAADNDARAALAGEVAWGAARGVHNALMLTLGTGVGGGILADGRILRGAAGVAGHLGHYTIDADGPPCICGNRGCLETYFSSKALESAARALVHRGVPSTMPSDVTCAGVFAAAAVGDEAAGEVVAQGIRRLAGAAAGLFLAFDPEVLILGGQVIEAGEALLAPLREQVWARTRLMLRRDVPIVASEVGGQTGIIGAAALVRTA